MPSPMLAAKRTRTKEEKMIRAITALDGVNLANGWVMLNSICSRGSDAFPSGDLGDVGLLECSQDFCVKHCAGICHRTVYEKPHLNAPTFGYQETTKARQQRLQYQRLRATAALPKPTRCKVSPH